MDDLVLIIQFGIYVIVVDAKFHDKQIVFRMSDYKCGIFVKCFIEVLTSLRRN